MATRAVRVGVLIKGTLVEERVLAGPAAVTLGQSLKCTLSVPVDGLPREHVLFTHDRDGAVRLNVAPNMSGRLSGGELASGALAHGTRGKLAIGDATILFQELAAPPVVPRPQLPASIRGTLGDRIDRRLAVIVGASLALHVGIACWAWTTDVEDDTLTAMAQPRAYVEPTVESMNIDDFTPPPAQTPAPTPGVAAATPAHHPDPIRQITRPTTHHPAPQDEAAAFLTNGIPGLDGHDEMPHRTTTTHLDDQIRDARDHHVTIGDDPRVRDHREHVGPGHDPIVDGPDGPTEIKKGPEDPGTPLAPQPPAQRVTATTLTADMVLARINGIYTAGLARCYQKGLVHDASLQGTIHVAFVVTPDGNVSRASASGVSDDVDACVQRLMDTWTFSAPHSASGGPAEAPFHLSLALQGG